MKLRNKKTGEIGYFCFANWTDTVLIITDKNGIQLAKYNSLAELNKEWEDAPEEPKRYWYMSNRGDVRNIDDEDTDWDNNRKEIGNYYDTKEEAEKAVEKLKAWKRLKDKGFRFDGWYIGNITNNTNNHIDFSCHNGKDWKDIAEYLDTLFWQGKDDE